jgi:hypothetical protein
MSRPQSSNPVSVAPQARRPARSRKPGHDIDQVIVDRANAAKARPDAIDITGLSPEELIADLGRRSVLV